MVISPNRFWGILLATIKGVKPAGWIRGGRGGWIPPGTGQNDAISTNAGGFVVVVVSDTTRPRETPLRASHTAGFPGIGAFSATLGDFAITRASRSWDTVL